MLSTHHGFVGICLLLAVERAGGPDGVNQRVFLYQGGQWDQVVTRMSRMQWVDWGRDGDAQPPAALPPLPMVTVQPPGLLAASQLCSVSSFLGLGSCCLIYQL